jgi:glycine cleavage system H protein
MVSPDAFNIPADAKLCETHEYIRMDDNRARIGISHHAVEQLGDIVFVDLPEVGLQIEKGETFGSVESIKAASDLYMPLTGEVIAVNAQLTSTPELVNDDCYGDGWLIEIELSNPSEAEGLMDPKGYLKFLADNT